MRVKNGKKWVGFSAHRWGLQGKPSRWSHWVASRRVLGLALTSFMQGHTIVFECWWGTDCLADVDTASPAQSFCSMDETSTFHTLTFHTLAAPRHLPVRGALGRRLHVSQGLFTAGIFHTCMGTVHTSHLHGDCSRLAA
eukprot:283349-Chlamydomonas_euryale.AAC.2